MEESNGVKVLPVSRSCNGGARFMYPTAIYKLNFRCVAHYIFQINIEQEAEECDATEVIQNHQCRAQKNYCKFSNRFMIAVSPGFSCKAFS
jgi:hypothetical protein